MILQKLEDGVLSRFIDITQEKRNKEKIESQSNLLKGILDSSINSIFALNSVRNAEGKIIDFIFLEFNNKFERFLGKKRNEIIGQSYQSVMNLAMEDEMFEIKCTVVEILVSNIETATSGALNERPPRKYPAAVEKVVLRNLYQEKKPTSSVNKTKLTRERFIMAGI